MPADSETLHCEAGHDWARPVKRGKKPKFCPEHAPKPAAKLSPEEAARRRAEGREKAQAERKEAGIAKVIAFRDWSKTDASLYLEYRAGHITWAEYVEQRPDMPERPTKTDYENAGVEVADEEGDTA